MIMFKNEQPDEDITGFRHPHIMQRNMNWIKTAVGACYNLVKSNTRERRRRLGGEVLTERDLKPGECLLSLREMYTESLSCRRKIFKIVRFCITDREYSKFQDCLIYRAHTAKSAKLIWPCRTYARAKARYAPYKTRCSQIQIIQRRLYEVVSRKKKRRRTQTFWAGRRTQSSSMEVICALPLIDDASHSSRGCNMGQQPMISYFRVG